MSLLFPSPLKAWQEPQEKIYLQLAEDVLLAGEQVWFSAWLAEDGTFPPTAGSQVIYVELLNPEGQQVMSSKLKVTDGAAHGDWLLPDDVPGGWYQLRAYTQWMRNFSSDRFFHQQVLVINPLQKAQDSVVLRKIPQPLTETVLVGKTSKTNLSLYTDKASYTPREKVNLKITFPDTDGHPKVATATVSVHQVNNFVSSQPEHASPGPQAQIASEGQAEYQKEEEELTLRGTLTDAKGTPLQDRMLLFSIPGSNPRFDYATTDTQGRFAFPLVKVYGKQEIVLQLYDATEPYRIVLDKKFVSGTDISTTDAAPETISRRAWQAFVEAQKKRVKINRIYGLYKEDTSQVVEVPENPYRFYGSPNFIRNLEDYISLPTLEEVCREILPGVILKDKKGNPDLNIFDINRRKMLGKQPMVLVDGVPVYNMELLLALSPDTIQRIETVNRKTYYGEFPMEGTLAIYTKSGQEYLRFLPASALHQQYTFYAQPSTFTDVSPEARTPEKGRTPDFRRLLYWNPVLQPDPQSNATLEFFTSDETGTFEIVVAGMTTAGTHFAKTIRFQVVSVFN